MLILYNLSHTQIAGLSKYKDLKLEKELNVDDTLSFSLPIEDANTALIQEEYYVRTTTDEYVVKELNYNDDDWVECVCKLNLEALKSASFTRFEAVDKTCTYATNLALAGTGWTLDSCDVTKERTVKKNYSTAYAVLRAIQEAFDCEMSFDSINKEITIKAVLGQDRGAYFAEQLNLRMLRVQKNSYKFATKMIPLGKNGLTISSVNGGLNYITNTQYSSKVITIYWEDNTYTDASKLKEDAITRLAKISLPYKSYGAAVVDLAKLSGSYSILDYTLGDTITLLSHRKHTQEKQRIVKLVQYLDEPERNTCEISNNLKSLEEDQTRYSDSADIVTTVTTQDGQVDGAKIDAVDWPKVSNVSISSAMIQDLAVVEAKIGNLAVTAAKIALATIEAAQIKDATITGAKIANATIDTAQIKDLAVTAAKIALATIDTAQIKDLAVTGAKIANATIDTAQIKDLAVTAAKIALATIEAAQIKDATITGAKIANATIDTAQIKDLAVTAAKIALATIEAAQIKDATITGAKIASATIEDANIKDATITGAKIKAANIDTAQIKDAAITSVKIGAAAITNAALDRASVNKIVIVEGDISDAAITNAKIGDAAISMAKIQNASIDTAQIVDGAITNALIQGEAVGTSQIQDASITDAKIVSLGASKIAAGTIDAGVITVQNLVAGNITTGTLNGDRLADDTIINRMIADGAVKNQNIFAATITGDKLVAEAITAREIAAGAISANQILAGAITGDKIAAGAITADKLAAGLILATLIRTGVLASTNDNISFDLDNEIFRIGQHILDITAGTLKFTSSQDAEAIDYEFKRSGGDMVNVLVSGTLDTTEAISWNQVLRAEVRSDAGNAGVDFVF